jgi:hypothetical protein
MKTLKTKNYRIIEHKVLNVNEPQFISNSSE